MIQVHNNLWVGNEADYNSTALQKGWMFVTAAKEPWHRDALGYTGRAADPLHPEYLIARRGNRLILNLVDAPNPSYIRKSIVDEAVKHVAACLAVECTVLVHCNEGRSRSPMIAMLYLASIKALPEDFLDAEVKFRSIYPPYNPGTGVRGFLSANYAGYWDTEASQDLAPVKS